MPVDGEIGRTVGLHGSCNMDDGWAVHDAFAGVAGVNASLRATDERETGY